MKSIMEELNNIDNIPITKVDDSIKIYGTEDRFIKKRESATALIKRVGLPNKDLYSPQLHEVEKILMQDEQIRTIWYNNEWWISTFDVIRYLTNTKNPSMIWSNLKKQNEVLRHISHKFKLLSKDNKYRFAICGTIEDTARVVLYVPSPKAENLMRFLVKTSNKKIHKETSQTANS